MQAFKKVECICSGTGHMGLGSGCSWYQNKLPGFAAMRGRKSGAKFLFHLKKLEFIYNNVKQSGLFPL